MTDKTLEELKLKIIDIIEDIETEGYHIDEAYIVNGEPEKASIKIMELIQSALSIQEEPIRVDEIKTLRRKMESSSYDVGMGAWTVLYNREQELTSQQGEKKV